MSFILLYRRKKNLQKIHNNYISLKLVILKKCMNLQLKALSVFSGHAYTEAVDTIDFLFSGSRRLQGGILHRC